MGDNRPAVYWDEGIEKWVYRASSLGNCLGALVRCRVGLTPAPPPGWLQKKFDEGNIHEAGIIEQVRNQGWKVEGDGEGEQYEWEIEVGQEAVVRLHPDGIATGRKVNHEGHIRVLEVKAVSESFYQTLEKAMPEFYKWQLSCEMESYREQFVPHFTDPSEYHGALYVFGIKDVTGEKIDQVVLKLVNKPPYSLVDIKMRVLGVERMAREYEETGKFPECEYKQYPCGFWQDAGCLGGQKVGDGLEDIWGVLGDKAIEVRHWLIEWNKAKALVDKWTPKMKEAQEEVLKVIGERADPIMSGQVFDLGSFKAKYRVREGSRRIEKAKIVEAGLDVERFMGEKSKDSKWIELVKEKDEGNGN